ncbi:hypothetical protein CONCODRAFT_79634 [Conidiobolus coronatus NRRL 28638]|uniref:C2H2-type domain-containing protein n=1 Tax=Conidiobolus coronatus (strain ATCC 28846 / CBS 209.66 / NRRL 28638) TaxID=796925 RepID=A0A137P155_CONC2|nr:hypothetical protein CONCODRAFT_79634 [Conidiobolus coronatus NRRL 28638]|eukprot:KXN68800.1 hypothetical protein CONCODRAFT_79634 [Conidiobolus coronatus NRRL 28638]
MSYNNRVTGFNSISVRSYSSSAEIPSFHSSTKAALISPPSIPYVSRKELIKHLPNQLLDLPHPTNHLSDPINYKLEKKRSDQNYSNFDSMPKKGSDASTTLSNKKIAPAPGSRLPLKFEEGNILHTLPIESTLPPISKFINHPLYGIFDKKEPIRDPKYFEPKPFEGPNSNQKSTSSTAPYSCPTCNLKFGRKNSLRRHEQLHSGVKPFHCSACNRSFSRKDIYIRHLNSKRCQRISSLRHSDVQKSSSTESTAPTRTDQQASDLTPSESNSNAYSPTQIPSNRKQREIVPLPKAESNDTDLSS